MSGRARLAMLGQNPSLLVSRVRAAEASPSISSSSSRESESGQIRHHLRLRARALLTTGTARFTGVSWITVGMLSAYSRSQID